MGFGGNNKLLGLYCNGLWQPILIFYNVIDFLKNGEIIDSKIANQNVID